MMMRIGISSNNALCSGVYPGNNKRRELFLLEDVVIRPTQPVPINQFLTNLSALALSFNNNSMAYTTRNGVLHDDHFGHKESEICHRLFATTIQKSFMYLTSYICWT